MSNPSRFCVVTDIRMEDTGDYGRRWNETDVWQVTCEIQNLADKYRSHLYRYLISRCDEYDLKHLMLKVEHAFQIVDVPASQAIALIAQHKRAVGMAYSEMTREARERWAKEQANTALAVEQLERAQLRKLKEKYPNA